MKRQPVPETLAPIGEPMISAREAAEAFGLPEYWFRDRTMRARKRIPHYHLVGLVRFRFSELIAWTTECGQPESPEQPS